MNEITVQEAWTKASSFLMKHKIESPQRTAEEILRHHLRWDRTMFLTRWNEPLDRVVRSLFESDIERRAQGEPLQYIVGTESFYGLQFKVTPAVLIPRPETELLIDQVIAEADKIWSDGPLSVIEIGSGSGAIAIALAHAKPAWQITSIDISMEAIRIAEENAVRNGVADRIRFIHGDLLEPIEARRQQGHILVSNPPYIPTTDVEILQIEVREYEPRLALDGGHDGLDPYRRMIANLGDVLYSPGLVAFEVGIHQADKVEGMLLDTGHISTVNIYPDFQQIPRVVVGYKN